MKKSVDREIIEKINKSRDFLIASHVRPDADAVGSLLGLGLALLKQGKQVQMVLADGAGRFDYLPNVNLITRSPRGKTDMIIVVDCSDIHRVGGLRAELGKPDLVVDHHKTNERYGVYNIVEPDQVATAAILFDHFPEWGLTCDPHIATCLLSGIVGDTIGYRTPNVNAEVMRKSAVLMDLGANLADIYREELVMKSYKAYQYWGSGLSRLKVQDGLVWTSLTLADRLDIGYPENDDADLVNILSAVREARIALIFVEQSKNEVKISWRARPGWDVSGIAYEFGGGGHAAAAGADVKGSLQDVQNLVIPRTIQLINQQSSELEMERRS